MVKMERKEAKEILKRTDEKTCPNCGMYLEIGEDFTGYCFIRCPDYDCGWRFDD